jgi:hypothetical protein
MIDAGRLAQLQGEWVGINRLWLTPEDETRESEGSASLEVVAQGQCVSFRYGWSFDGGAQDGILLAGIDRDGAQAVWTDSWHMSRSLMICTGDAAADGVLSVSGSYAAPTGPDWGWRIALSAEGDGLAMRMYNIPPGIEEVLAVEALYTRR